MRDRKGERVVDRETKAAMYAVIKYLIVAATFGFVLFSSLILGLGAYESGIIETISAAILSIPIWGPIGFILTKGYQIADKNQREALKKPPRFELAKMKLS